MANINLEALKKKIIGKQNANPGFCMVCISVPTFLADCLFPPELFCRTQCPVCELAVPRVGKAFRFRLLLTSCCTCFMSELTYLLKWQKITPEIKYKTFLLWEFSLNSWWRVWWVADPCTEREWGSYCWDAGSGVSETSVPAVKLQLRWVLKASNDALQLHSPFYCNVFIVVSASVLT